MFKFKQLKKTTAIVIAFIMTIFVGFGSVEAVPIDPLTINMVKLTEYIAKDGSQNYILYISGNNLKERNVKIVSSDGSIFNLGYGSDNSDISYNINPSMKDTTGKYPLNINANNTIKIDGYSGGFPINLSSLPALAGVTPTRIYNNGSMEILGNGFDKLNSSSSTYDASMYMHFSGRTIGLDNITDNDIKINNIGSSGINQPGSYDVEIGKSDTQNSVQVIQEVKYAQQFKIIQNLTGINVTQFNPNKGVSGDTSLGTTSSVFRIEGTGMNSNMSVFFMKKNDGSEDYSLTYKSPKVEVAQDPTDNTKTLGLDVTVPYNIEAGDYYIALTNKVPSDQDPNITVNSEYIIKDQKFSVVKDGRQMKVYDVNPAVGTDSGLDAIIEGRYIGTLNLDNAEFSGQPTVSVSADGKSLTYTYDNNNGNVTTYQGQNVTITKTITMKIGDEVSFDPSKQQGNVLSNSVDSIKIKIPSISVDKEQTRDITVDTATEVKDASNSIIASVTENAVKQDGFTFEPSNISPSVQSVTPSYGDKNSDIYMSIKGKNFLVYKYIAKDGTQKVKYPKIIIGNNIILDKNVDPTITLDVLDDNNIILDGSKTQMLGTDIVVKIPAQVKDQLGNLINKPDGKQNISVQNPVIDNGDGANGMTDVLADAFEFKTPADSDVPSITTVDPSMVSTDGNVDVKITGNNFKPGCKVVIDGQEMAGIKVDGKGETITFKTTAYRPVDTLLQVINPSGGTASHQFVYTKTYTDPKITTISPDMGKANTIVTIIGSNFITPDTTAKFTELQRLIGTTVLFDGVDVNEYNKVGDNIVLKSYTNGKVLGINSSNDVEINNDYEDTILQSDYSSIRVYKTLDSRVILQDGSGLEYSLFVDSDGKIKMRDKYNNVKNIDYSSTDGAIGIDGVMYYAKTPYVTNVDSNGVQHITGKHTFVKDDSTIEVIVPSMINGNPMQEGSKDVTVKNPDTKSVTKQDGFYYYAQPKSKPQINDVTPDQGTQSGGNVVKITGKDFYDGIRVFFGAQEADSKTITLTTEGSNDVIYVTVPKYEGDLLKDKGISSLTVPVVVVNEDGGSASQADGYQYLVPVSHPKITQISPNADSAAGGTTVTIIGSDFRDYEPFTDLNGDGTWESGEPYIDINKNGKYDEGAVKTNGDYDSENRALLPKVFFGGKQAQIIDFSTVKTMTNGQYSIVDKIDCILPGYSKQGAVDVSVMNTDGGTAVLKNGFNYKQSKPQITSTIPAVGPKTGGTTVTINGSGFVTKDLTVKFGDVTNAGLAMNDPNSGNIIAGRASVALGNVNVQYSLSQDSNNTGAEQVTVTGILNGTTYSKTYSIPVEGYMYINLGSLMTQSKDGKTQYAGLGMPGYDTENIRIDIQGGMLIVTRGYAAKVTGVSDKLITVVSPPVDVIGEYELDVINADGGTASSKFQYTNPASKPKIYNIQKGNENPKRELLGNGTPVLIQEVSSKGGSQLTITGDDFRDNLKVKIGDKDAVVVSDPILANSIIISVPKGDDAVGKLLRVVITNEDGASADSGDLTPPIYVRYTLAESNPKITSVAPKVGSAIGGTQVKIVGTGFKDGAKVYFGSKLANSINVVDYKTITCTVPAGAPGDTDITVENPDSGQDTLSKGFMYISYPIINDVTPKTASVDGGDSITIRGTGFLSGATVYFGPTIEAYNDKNPQTGDVIYIGSQKFVVTDGTKAADTTVVDSETITVTAPQAKLGTKGLIVVNSDSGATDIYNDFKYVISKPQAPTSVTAEYVFNGYIRVGWSPIANADYYKVYKIVNGQYYFADVTKDSSYLERNLQTNSNYKFAIVAVKGVAESDYSLESNVVTTPQIVTNPSDDGSLDMLSSINLENGGTVNVNVGLDNVLNSVDLTDYEYKDAKNIIVNIPAYLIKNTNQTFDIILSGCTISVPTTAFRVREFQDLNDDDLKHSAARIKINLDKDNLVLSKIPKNVKILSGPYSIDGEVQIGKQITELEQLVDNFNINIGYDDSSLSNKNVNSVKAYSYDYDNTVWNSTKSTSSQGCKQISSNQLGTFAVMANK